MGKQAANVVYVASMVAVVVGVDVLFSGSTSGSDWHVNVGIVLVFAAFSFTFVSRR